MPRTLRMQVLTIAVLSVALVVGASDWLAAKLSEDAFRADLVDRVENAIARIEGADAEPARLESLLRGIVLDNRDVAALDVSLAGGHDRRLVASTHEGSRVPVQAGSAMDATRDSPLQEEIVLPDGAPGTRLLRTVQLAGGRTAIVRCDVSLEASQRLRSSLRRLDVALLLPAVGLLAFAMDFFFRRRVEPRIARLSQAMARAAEGRFEEPIEPSGSVELDSLGTSLNAMLLRVRELNQGLEERVGRATEELASRNRDLEERGEELRELQAEAVRSERFAALGQTIATLAHELGTPLNSVLGYTQLLKQDETNPEQMAKLEVIESQVRRMIETIRKMLGHAREGAVERQSVDVSHLVEEVLALVEPRAEEEGIELRPEIADGIDKVEVDPIAVRQIMVNLINNALDAEGTTRVLMRVARVAEEPEGLEVEVSDDGGGIPKEDHESIFQPFYTTKETGRGTGLGLAIVSHLVRAHAGQITLESAPGSGTTFRVRLPRGDGA